MSKTVRITFEINKEMYKVAENIANKVSIKPLNTRTSVIMALVEESIRRHENDEKANH